MSEMATADVARNEHESIAPDDGVGEGASESAGRDAGKGAGEVEPRVPDAAEDEGEDHFEGKVSLRTKLIVAIVFVAVFLASFFSGTYSMAGGYSLGAMLQVTGEHLNAYFYLWGQFFAHPITASGDFATQAQSFFDNLYRAFVGADAGQYVSNRKLDLALFSIRFPRIVLALVVGAALSCAGASFQGMFKNPLVSPDLLGASAGASLGACLAMLNGMPNIVVQAGAFAGALAAVGITVWMRSFIKSDAILGLVLAGMLVSTLFQSGMSFIKLVADTNNTLPAITYWLMGSFHDSTIEDIVLAIIPMLLGFALMLSQSWELNVMSFGDDEARSLGVNTRRARIVVILGATLVTGTSVAVSGIIGWVGLVIPHFARAVVGPNYRVLLPACVVLGSAYLLVVDDLARMLIPGANIPIGILTAVLGVPLFLVIFRRTSRGW